MSKPTIDISRVLSVVKNFFLENQTDSILSNRADDFCKDLESWSEYILESGEKPKADANSVFIKAEKYWGKKIGN